MVPSYDLPHVSMALVEETVRKWGKEKHYAASRSQVLNPQASQRLLLVQLLLLLSLDK